MNSLRPLIFIVITLIISSCSSDDDGSTSVTNQNDGELIAEVNGNSFLSSSTNTTANIESGVLNILATNSDGDRIAIAINNFDSTGTFDLSGFTTDATGIYIPDEAVRFFSTENEGGTGSITISELDNEENTITGSFSYTAIRQSTNDNEEPVFESVEIRNGSFSKIFVRGL